ncbi:MAG: [ribosomal protein S5]-alanine N-acetyltransferase [Sphingomonadales bacterium]|jgi:RimJ/RimL family protein N-acetyltransferase|nr:[ribosomal protein S5]-alanine N-acetyltransferase [Sphingomonadales bacterium]
MTLALEPIALDMDPARFAAELAPAFGGEEKPAREILAQTIALLTKDPRPAPWISYLARQDGEAIGICAFKSAPPPAGEVELAYMTFPAHERRGHAAGMIALLAGIADQAGIMPIAHTLPEENASNKALKRNGFAFAGEVEDPEDGLVWRWERPRTS